MPFGKFKSAPLVIMLIFAASCSLEPSGRVLSGSQDQDNQASKSSQDSSCGEGSHSSQDPFGTVNNIINSKCIGCHGPNQTPPELGTPEKITSNKAQIIGSVLNETMPPGSPLAPNLMDAFKAWENESSSMALVADNDYVNTIRPMFNTKCVFCHSNSGLFPKGPYLDSFSRARSKASESQEEMNKGDMPEPNEYITGSQSDTSLLANWIANGRPEGIEPSYPDKVNFDSHVKPFINGNCLGCHSNGKANPDFSTPQGVASVAQLILVDLENKSMPPGGVIYDSEVQMIARWVTQLDKGLGDDGSGATGCGL